MSDPLHEAMLRLNPIVEAETDYSDVYYDGAYEVKAVGVTYQQATEQWGYTRAKAEYPEYRRLLQAFGTEVVRELFGDNVWVDIMKRRASEASATHDVIVTGIRYPNEVKAIRELGGELWWVTREGTNLTDENPPHASESSVNADDFDVIIPNEGTIGDLHREVDIYR